MMKKCKKEEGEIKEAIEQLEEMSADEKESEKEREIYEIRERSRLVYNTEMYEARRKGLEEGKKIRRETRRKTRKRNRRKTAEKNMEKKSRKEK